jgi:hypothetical protein
MGNQTGGPLMPPKKTFWKYGNDIKVQLGKANYFEGEEGEVTLHFEVGSECPPFQASIVLEGWEKVHWKIRKTKKVPGPNNRMRTKVIYKDVRSTNSVY